MSGGKKKALSAVGEGRLLYTSELDGQVTNAVCGGIQWSVATESDLPSLTALASTDWRSTWSEQGLKSSLQAGCYGIEMAKQGQLALGFFILDHRCTDMELHYLAVQTAFRRCGVGWHVLQRVILQARLKEAKALFLEVAAGNIAALNLYRQAGFVRVGTRKGYYATPCGYEDAFILRHVFAL